MCKEIRNCCSISLNSQNSIQVKVTAFFFCSLYNHVMCLKFEFYNIFLIKSQNELVLLTVTYMYLKVQQIRRIYFSKTPFSKNLRNGLFKGTQSFPRIGLFVVQAISLGLCRRPIEFLTSSHPCRRLSKIPNSQIHKVKK